MSTDIGYPEGLQPLLTTSHNRIFWEDQVLFLLFFVLGFISQCLLRESSSHKCSTSEELLLTCGSLSPAMFPAVIQEGVSGIGNSFVV